MVAAVTDLPPPLDADSEWKSWGEQQPVINSTSLVYLDQPRFFSRYAICSYVQCGSGTIMIVNGMSLADLDAGILWWKYLIRDEIE